MTEQQVHALAERDVEIAGAAGLHARPAADFAAAAARFDSAILVIKGERRADAKSVLLLLTLDVRQGDRVTIRAEGGDAEQAVAALARLVDPVAA